MSLNGSIEGEVSDISYITCAAQNGLGWVTDKEREREYTLGRTAQEHLTVGKLVPK